MRRSRVTKLCAVLALVALPAVGDEVTQPEAAPPALPTFAHARMWQGPLLLAPTVPQVAGEGMRAAIDAKTGRLRQPTLVELRQLDEATPRTGVRRSVALSQRVHADGTVSMPLDPDLMSYSVVQVAADGALAQRCVDGPADAHLHPVAASAAGQE
jgi:hypothetical protein